jgi:acyl-CoA synthetase (AMP-forming)/AMP-acid ligase II
MVAWAMSLSPPSLTFQGRDWSGETLAAMAAGWHARVAERLPAAPEAVAVVARSHPETFALLFALSALPVPVVLLHPEPTTWRSTPPFSAVMPVFLSPATAEFAPALAKAGLSPVVLPEPGERAAAAQTFLSTPGFVIFTSGSTGTPKPGFRSTRGLLLVVRTIAETYGLPHGARIAACLPLATSFGLGQNFLLPAYLGGHVGLLERFDHRSLLNLFAHGEYDYWPGTALMADLLVRAPLGEWSGRAPAICHISSGHVAEPVYRGFLERFGVPIRQSYGRTECSFITSDTAPVGEIRPETVGFPSPGVEIRCGDTPEAAAAPGEPGRIWIRVPWHSEVYGYPPRLEPIARTDGWCATEDVGILTAEGRLIILGRIDDCFKTAGGYLVSSALVASAFRGHPDVIDAVAVPVQRRGAAVIGVLVAARSAIEPDAIHTLARRSLPGWLQPGVVAVRREIPALVTGKHDREACVRLLEAELRAAPPAAGS